MLHIYWSDLRHKVDQELDPKEFEARIIVADIIINDTLKLMKSLTSHDALYTLMQKLTLL